MQQQLVELERLIQAKMWKEAEELLSKILEQFRAYHK